MKTKYLKGLYSLEFDKITYQGTVFSEDTIEGRKGLSRVFWLPDENDVYFDNIYSLPMNVSEDFRNTIKEFYK